MHAEKSKQQVTEYGAVDPIPVALSVCSESDRYLIYLEGLHALTGAELRPGAHNLATPSINNV